MHVYDWDTLGHPEVYSPSLFSATTYKNAAERMARHRMGTDVAIMQQHTETRR